jgi:hypothetical protein
MVAAIGARRTETAYHRLLQATAAEDVEVEVGGYGEEGPNFIENLRRLPQVADMGLESVAPVAPDMPGDPPEFSPLTRFVAVMSVDGRAGWTVNHPLILAGRRPDPGRPDEVGLSESLARRWGVRPGDAIRLRALTPSSIAHFPPAPRIRLERGRADLAAFTDAARRLARDAPEVSVITRADLALRVDQATQAQVVALVLFAALAAVAALVVIGQTLTRELMLATAATTRSEPSASPLMPMGLARRAEPAPGLAVHLAGIGIGIGIVATVVLIAGWVAVPAWRLARARPDTPDTAGRVGAISGLAERAARAGLPLSSVAGLRMALEQGRAR